MKKKIEKKNKERKINWLKVLWISNIYILLLVILWIVVIYKVKWQYVNIEEEKYLYFYDCSGYVCTTDEPVTDYFSKFACSSTCPYVKKIMNDNILELSYDGELIKYDYINGLVVERGVGDDS